MDEARCEGKEPKKAKKQRYTGDNLDVDEARQRLVTARPIVMQVLANNTCDNLFDGQLSPEVKELYRHSLLRRPIRQREGS